MNQNADPRPAPLRVLLVDGHPGVRAALLEALDRAALVGSVAAVGTVRAALAVLRELSPDIVICDPRTLAGSPPEIIACLSGSRSPLVVHTSSLDEGDGARWARAGAAAVLLKGGDLSALLAQVAAASRRASATLEAADGAPGLGPRGGPDA